MTRVLVLLLALSHGGFAAQTPKTVDVTGALAFVEHRDIGSTREYVVKVANRRDAPLEAWSAVVLGTETGRTLQTMTRDTVRELERGMLPPGIATSELFAIGTYRPEATVAEAVTVRIELVMWQDLEWQGLPHLREQALAGRERIAEEHAFFIGTLRSAAELPASQALTLLRGRQREFSQGPLGRQSSGLKAQMVEWEGLAARAPATLVDQMLASELKAHAAALERSRVALIRHRARPRP
jgi:hypothetical protein